MFSTPPLRPLPAWGPAALSLHIAAALLALRVALAPVLLHVPLGAATAGAVLTLLVALNLVAVHVWLAQRRFIVGAAVLHLLLLLDASSHLWATVQAPSSAGLASWSAVRLADVGCTVLSVGVAFWGLYAAWRGYAPACRLSRAARGSLRRLAVETALCSMWLTAAGGVTLWVRALAQAQHLSAGPTAMAHLPVVWLLLGAVPSAMGVVLDILSTQTSR